MTAADAVPSENAAFLQRIAWQQYLEDRANEKRAAAAVKTAALPVP